MAPDLAAALIDEYTQPGDWVLDPLAGIGTTLVEAIHLGRNAYGVEIEAGWVTLARANIAHARRQGAPGHARIKRGDATRLPRGVPTELRGRFALVVTSPPCGKTMHGRVEHRRGPLKRFHNSYGNTSSNLAHEGRAGLVEGITAVLAGCQQLVRPGGVIAVVSRPWRRDRLLVDLPGQIVEAGAAVGLRFAHDRRACHAAARDGRLLARHSFFQLHVARRTRAKESRPACPNTTSLPSSSAQSSLRAQRNGGTFLSQEVEHDARPITQGRPRPCATAGPCGPYGRGP